MTAHHALPADTTQPRPRLLVLTGAGLSAESGIPTFRVGTDALWEGHSIKEVCYFPTWKANRIAVHAFYDARRASAALAQPNAAHRALAGWQARWGAELLTQNVDDLLERAGASTVIHLHGRLSHMLCTACAHRFPIDRPTWDSKVDRCPKCDSYRGVKPDVVMFAETAPEYAHLHRAIESLSKRDVVVVMGTSCEVLPFDQMLAGSPAYKVVNSLNPIEELGKRVLVFDNVLGMPASEAVKRLQPVLEARLG